MKPGMGFANALMLSLAACSLVKTFDALVLRDAAGTLFGRSIAYAPGPKHLLDVYVPTARIARGPVIMLFYGGGARGVR